MLSRSTTLFAVACLFIGLPRAAGAIEWNAVTQFSATKNPNTYWSYSTNALPLKKAKAVCSIPKFVGWTTGEAVPNSISVVRNRTGAEVDCLTIRTPTDHLDMDPESGAITVSWTAPSSGTFLIKGDFLGIDTGQNAHPVSIAVTGAPRFLPVLSPLTVNRAIQDQIGNFGRSDHQFYRCGRRRLSQSQHGAKSDNKIGAIANLSCSAPREKALARHRQTYRLL